jgi:hypothetical protein
VNVDARLQRYSADQVIAIFKAMSEIMKRVFTVNVQDRLFDWR